MTSIDAEAVAAAVVAVPGVARMSGGVSGEVATYLPGRRVTGVRLRSSHVVLHVIANAPSRPFPELGTTIRQAVLDGFPDIVSVDVSFDDVDLVSEPAVPGDRRAKPEPITIASTALAVPHQSPQAARSPHSGALRPEHAGAAFASPSGN